MILKNAKLEDRRLILEFDENQTCIIEDPEFTILFDLFKTLVVLDDTRNKYCGPVKDWKPGPNPIRLSQNGV